MFGTILRRINSLFSNEKTASPPEVAFGIYSELLPSYPTLDQLRLDLVGDVGSDNFTQLLVDVVSATSKALVLAKAIDEAKDAEFRELVLIPISMIPKNPFSMAFAMCIFEDDANLTIYTDLIDPQVLAGRRQFLKEKIDDHARKRLTE